MPFVYTADRGSYKLRSEDLDACEVITEVVLPSEPCGIALSSDERLLAVPSSGGTYIINCSDLAIVQTLDHGWGYAASFSADGRWLAACGMSHHVFLFSATPSGLFEVVLASEEGHSSEVYDVVFSPSSRRLLSSSEDRTSIVWSVPSEGASGLTILRVLQGHTQDVACGLFLSEDTVATGGTDGSIHSIEISPGWATLSLTPDGSLLACGLLNKTVLILETYSFQPICEIPAQDDVYRVWFADNKVLLIGAINSPMETYDLSMNSEPVQFGGLINPRIVTSKRGERPQRCMCLLTLSL